MSRMLFSVVIVSLIPLLAPGEAPGQTVPDSSRISPEYELQWSAEVDLDGDGDLEDIRLIPLEREGKPCAFSLTVDGSTVVDKLSGTCYEIAGFLVVDVDQLDQYKEIAVHGPGLSDSDQCFYFWFNGKSLHRIGKLASWPHLPGDGTVLVNSWKDFWKKRDKYVLTQDHKFQLVPQEFYWVGEQATVIRPLSIHSSRDYERVQTELQVDEKVAIVLYAPGGSPAEGFSGHYLIRSANGQPGWVKRTIQNMNYSFKGLMWAS